MCREWEGELTYVERDSKERNLMMTLTGDEVICTYVENSVIRFGEILPLWQNCTNLWQLFECLISMCQTFEPTLENSV